MRSSTIRSYPIDPPDPIEAIKSRMEQQGLTRKDLEEIIGTRTRVAEVLNRKRGLSITMIRRLHERLLHLGRSLDPTDSKEGRVRKAKPGWADALTPAGASTSRRADKARHEVARRTVELFAKPINVAAGIYDGYRWRSTHPASHERCGD
jgi:transcriptional regulator with XRE-family HTH domain